jgi:flagellar biosynthetic protein FlhB
MGADSDQGERSEEATQTRREDFRKRGQIAQTRELPAVFVLFASLGLIWGASKFFYSEIHSLFELCYGQGFVAVARGQSSLFVLSKYALETTFWMTGPVLGVLLVISFAATAIQTGLNYNEEALQFNLERIDPLQGLFRIFSLKALVEGIKALFKLCVILGISYWLLKDQLMVLPQLIHFSLGQIFEYMSTLLIRLLSGVGMFMAFLAAGDYLFQRWEIEQEMKMTKQEVREEHKSREGDPMVKARIKRVQREIAGRRMMEEVPKADVIVTNPTHIAVALKYDETMVSPKLIAKGADLIAEKIKALAKEHAIPIVENKPLARTIFKTLKIGQAVPRELYTAVAEVLSYVYRLRRKRVR